MTKSNYNTQTIDKMVKEKFLTIFNDAQKEAENIFNKTIEPELIGKSNFDKIKFLKCEQDKASRLREDVQLSAFIGSATNEDWLLKLFASRITVLNIDDSVDLSKAVYYGRLRELISDKIFKVNDSIPSYSFDDFIKGKKEPIFLELNHRWQMDGKEDYDKIRFWQANKIVLMLSHETEIIIKNIQTALSENPFVNHILNQDLEKYKNAIKKKSFDSPSALINELNKLSFLTEYNFELINNENALTDFHKFQENDIIWNRITPEYLDQSRILLNTSGKLKPFSSSPLIFYTIAQIMQWIEKVVNGVPLMTPFNFPNYYSIVDEILKEAEEKADIIYTEFDKSIDFTNIDNKTLESLYIKVLEGLRYEFNDLEDYEKQYFASVPHDDVKQIFQVNAVFFDLDDHIKALKKAASIHYRLFIYLSAYREVSGQVRINYPNKEDDFDPNEINYLACTMVLDNDLHDKLTDVYSTGISDMIQYSLPLDLMIQNIKEQLHHVFINCIERLLEYLEDCEPGNKTMYIQSRLKELRQRELKGKEFTKRFNENLNYGYTTLFKEYLEIEAEFITSTKDVYFIPTIGETKKIKTIYHEEDLSFGYRENDDTKLSAFITQLNLKIGMLNESLTSPDQFVKVLTSKELNISSPGIHFNCETTQLYYIFNKLKNHFTKLTFKNIEKSQLFYTKNGNPLKGQNLSASKIENPKEQDEIDKAFSLLQ